MEASKVLTVLGAFFIFIHNGPFFYWGNLSIYLTSYINSNCSTGGGCSLLTLHTHTDQSHVFHPAWTIAFYGPTWATSMLVSGHLATYVDDVRIIVTFAIGVLGATFVCCYFFMGGLSLTGFFVLYGFLVGIGTGSYEGTVQQYFVASQYQSSKHLALITAIVLAGSPTGGLLISQFVTWYTNPRNIPPDAYIGKMKVFTQEEIVSKVPSMLLILGASTFALQAIGLLLLRHTKDKQNKQDDGSGDVVRAMTDYKSTSNSDSNSVRSVRVTQSNSSGQQDTNNQGDDKHPTTTSNGECVGSNTIDSNSNNSNSDISNAQTSDSDRTKPTRRNLTLTPCERLRSVDLYKIALINILGTCPRVVVFTYYKLYGQEWIRDDHFLTCLGSAQNLAVIPATVLWGLVFDRLGVRSTLVIMYSAMPVVSLLMYFAAQWWSQWAYFASTVLAAMVTIPVIGINFVTIKWFGSDHLAQTLGMIDILSVMGYTLPMLGLDFLIDKFGHFTEFAFGAVSSLIGLVVIIFTFPNN